MDSRRVWLAMLAAMVVAAAVVGAWWAWPRLAAALPGRVRHYVPAALLEAVTTPLPAALPPPTGPAPASLELALAAPTADRRPPTAAGLPPAGQGSGAAGEQGAVPTPPISHSPTLPIPSTPSPFPTPALPPYARIDGLPIIPQKFNNCGPTNLTIVLQYYGLEVDQFDVATVARPNYEDRNVSPDELVSYVTAQTELRAVTFPGGSVDLARRLLAAGFPVIIEKGLEPDAATGWMGHYLTLYGYDDVTGHFLARDTFLGPWRGDGLAAYRDTERMWTQFNGRFVVVYPPERATNVSAILGATFAEPAAAWAGAADQARAALALNPDDAFTWFNLGTSLTRLAGLGDGALYGGAVAAFDQARRLGLPPRMLWYQFEPYEAYLAVGRPDDVLALTDTILDNQGGRNVEETYLYRGRALFQTGDAEGARAAYERAAALNPQSPVGLAAVAELRVTGDE